MKNLCNSKYFKMLANILLNKLVFLILVLYVTCHAITITNYYFHMV
jgi:hypothetical protein